MRFQETESASYFSNIWRH